jgi:hypothetical protein
MNAKGVKILHVADSDAVVPGIPHHFIFNLFPALHASFNKNLRTGCKGFRAELT